MTLRRSGAAIGPSFALHPPPPLFARTIGQIARDSLDGFAAVPSGVDDGWSVGQRVFHDDYGPGTVVKKWYNVGELVLDVRFDSGRMGRFLPQYTPLEKLASDD